jgi:hypothetical protein
MKFEGVCFERVKLPLYCSVGGPAVKSIVNTAVLIEFRKVLIGEVLEMRLVVKNRATHLKNQALNLMYAWNKGHSPKLWRNNNTLRYLMCRFMAFGVSFVVMRLPSQRPQQCEKANHISQNYMPTTFDPESDRTGLRVHVGDGHAGR